MLKQFQGFPIIEKVGKKFYTYKNMKIIGDELFAENFYISLSSTTQETLEREGKTFVKITPKPKTTAAKVFAGSEFYVGLSLDELKKALRKWAFFIFFKNKYNKIVDFI